jgi:hypothetical protein
VAQAAQNPEPHPAAWDADRREALARQVAEFYAFLDGLDVVGYPKRAAELLQLDRLISLYPDDARRLLGR